MVSQTHWSLCHSHGSPLWWWFSVNKGMHIQTACTSQQHAARHWQGKITLSIRLYMYHRDQGVMSRYKVYRQQFSTQNSNYTNDATYLSDLENDL